MGDDMLAKIARALVADIRKNLSIVHAMKARAKFLR